jgi:hypothetical protein
MPGIAARASGGRARQCGFARLPVARLRQLIVVDCRFPNEEEIDMLDMGTIASAIGSLKTAGDIVCETPKLFKPRSLNCSKPFSLLKPAR